MEKSEKLLVGKAATKDHFTQAAALAIEDAKPAKYNKFKVELTKRGIARSLEIAAGGTV
jgi:xanthine dehydrogenase YagS FAD-binding subunit